MSYRYEDEKPWLLTDEGQRCFIKSRDNARELLKKAGAFMGLAPVHGVSVGDSFKMMAILDRMVELGDIREVTSGTWGQHRVFVSAGLV